MTGWWRRYLRWRQRNVASLVLSAGGFRLGTARQYEEVHWDEVQRIMTFKRDLMTVDLVCLAFELPTGAVEINEEMPGYDKVETAMGHRFALNTEWKLRVVFPAFEPNVATIYERPSIPELMCR